MTPNEAANLRTFTREFTDQASRDLGTASTGLPLTTGTPDAARRHPHAGARMMEETSSSAVIIPQRALRARWWLGSASVHARVFGDLFARELARDQSSRSAKTSSRKRSPSTAHGLIGRLAPAASGIIDLGLTRGLASASCGVSDPPDADVGTAALVEPAGPARRVLTADTELSLLARRAWRYHQAAASRSQRMALHAQRHPWRSGANATATCVLHLALSRRPCYSRSAPPRVVRSRSSICIVLSVLGRGRRGGDTGYSSARRAKLVNGVRSTASARKQISGAVAVYRVELLIKTARLK